MRHAVLALALAAATLAGSARAAERPLKIAVVRIQDAFADYERTKEMKAAIEADFQPDQQAIETLGNEVNSLKQELQADSMTEPGSFRHFEKLQAIRTKEYLLKTMREELRKQWNDRMIDFYKTIYSDFQRAVKEFAVNDQYDLVIRLADEELTNNSAMGIQNEIGLKIVHYAAPSLDRTDAIVAIMNRNWQASKRARGGR